MSRSFSATSLVALPRLTAVSTARLIKELLTAAAAEHKLPPSIGVDRDELAAAHEALEDELQKRITAGIEETPVVRAADKIEDNAIGALYDFLAAFERLPAERHEEAAEAAVIRQGMFPGGLAFLAIKPHDEWQEVETRIKLMAEKGWDKTIAKLGGKPFLDEVKHAHGGYGEALGLTVVKPVAEAPSLREARDAALDVVRAYVLQVSAHVRRSKPETGALAARLLKPLTEWQDKATKSNPSSGESAKPSKDGAPPV
ncbi:Hypothetical protein A7982_11073 [Minicystis rosea]|nr:Hypothetical protein A7982_11073 [Minicystis rosea]